MPVQPHLPALRHNITDVNIHYSCTLPVSAPPIRRMQTPQILCPPLAKMLGHLPLNFSHQAIPGVEEKLAMQVVYLVQAVRRLELTKPPGVAETLDCAQATMALGKDRLDAQTVEQTLGCLVKSMEDSAVLQTAGIETLLSQSN
jgi:hypothetical protein